MLKDSDGCYPLHLIITNPVVTADMLMEALKVASSCLNVEVAGEALGSLCRFDPKKAHNLPVHGAHILFLLVPFDP